MRIRLNHFLVLALAALLMTFPFSSAQQPQIPSLQVSNITTARGKATVLIVSRKDAAHAGAFTLDLTLKFNPAADDFPGLGAPSGIHVDLAESVQGRVVFDTVEQATSTGKLTPTVFLNGRCQIQLKEKQAITGCRYWLMVADNKPAQNREGTPDVISFLVFDKAGKRIAYGTGPVNDGDIDVTPTGN